MSVVQWIVTLKHMMLYKRSVMMMFPKLNETRHESVIASNCGRWRKRFAIISILLKEPWSLLYLYYCKIWNARGPKNHYIYNTWSHGFSDRSHISDRKLHRNGTVSWIIIMNRNLWRWMNYDIWVRRYGDERTFVVIPFQEYNNDIHMVSYQWQPFLL